MPRVYKGNNIYKTYTDQNLFWILHCIFYLQELSKREVVNVTHLVIPAELGALLQAAAGTAFCHANIHSYNIY